MARSAALLIALATLSVLPMACTPTEPGSDIVPQPTFTWRMGTVNGSDSIWTEGYALFSSPGAFEEFAIHWSGPDGFERDMTISNPHRIGAGWVNDLLPSGTYLAKATVSGVDFELPITYDATRTLPVPQVDLVEATIGRVELRVWQVEGAAYYDARLREAGETTTLGWVAGGDFAEPSRVLEIKGLELDPATTYEVLVLAYTAPAPWDPQMVAQQVDRSWALSEPFAPEPVTE